MLACGEWGVVCEELENAHVLSDANSHRSVGEFFLCEGGYGFVLSFLGFFVLREAENLNFLFEFP